MTNLNDLAMNVNKLDINMDMDMDMDMDIDLNCVSSSDELRFHNECKKITKLKPKIVTVDKKIHKTDREGIKIIKVLNNLLRNAIQTKINKIVINEPNVSITGVSIPDNLNFCLDTILVYISIEIDTYVNTIKSKGSETYINLYAEYLKLHAKIYMDDIKNMVTFSIMNIQDCESEKKEEGDHYIKIINEDIDLIISKFYTKITEVKTNIASYLASKEANKSFL